jgi:hypothetical protein
MQERAFAKGAPSSEISYYWTIVNQGHVDIQQQFYDGKPHLVYFYAQDWGIPIEIDLGLGMVVFLWKIIDNRICPMFWRF